MQQQRSFEATRVHAVQLFSHRGDERYTTAVHACAEEEGEGVRRGGHVRHGGPSHVDHRVREQGVDLASHFVARLPMLRTRRAVLQKAIEWILAGLTNAAEFECCPIACVAREANGAEDASRVVPNLHPVER